MTSGIIFPQRFTKIDDLTRSDHAYLGDTDHCYFIGEYTARKGYGYSVTNQLIFNFKKSMDRRGTQEWSYKERAIQECAAAFRAALGRDNLDRYTFVPIPPSKAKRDPMYDDRLVRMLHAIRPNAELDIRELIVQPENAPAAHENEFRPTPQEVKRLYRVDRELGSKEPRVFAIVDDILTTGAHYKAAQELLSEQFRVQSFGLFIARRAFHGP